MDMKELKPCPYCGSEAKVSRVIHTVQKQVGFHMSQPIFETESNRIRFVITCSNPDLECPVMPNLSNSDLQEAYKAWNKRTGMAIHDEENECWLDFEVDE